jgi:hypothetical protein
VEENMPRKAGCFLEFYEEKQKLRKWVKKKPQRTGEILWFIFTSRT